MIRKLSKLLGIALTITLLASLLSIAAPVSAASVEQPTVTTATTDISKATYYTIRFKVNKSLTGNATDKITIVFPSDTSLNAAKIAANTTVSASPGWFGVKFLDSNTAGVTVAADAMTRKITVTFNAATDKVGEGAEIRLQIDGITNPSEIDSYVLTVATSQETTAAESAPYDIKAPYIKPSAGTVEVFNSAGIRVFSDVGNAALQAGLNAASGRNYKVTVGPGTYTVNPVVKAGVTIESSSTAADTIIKGEWTVNETDTIFKTATVIKNLTLQANGKKVMWFGSDFAKVENCILKKKSVIVPNAETLVTVNGSVTFTGCTFETDAEKCMDTAIEIIGTTNGTSKTGVAITNCTFNIDTDEATIGTLQDKAIDVKAGGLVTVTGSTINGVGGIGYQDIANQGSIATIKTSTFSGLKNAVKYNSTNGSASLSMSENTITGCTASPIATAKDADAALNLEKFLAASTISIQKNTFKDNNGYAVVFADAAAVNSTKLSFTGNIFTGNVYGIKNADADGGTLKAILNYWGDNSGPTISTNPGGIGDPIGEFALAGGYAVEYRPWTNTSTPDLVADQTVPANHTLDKSNDIGLAYQSSVAVGGVSLMRYDGNPASSAPPGTPIADAYYDVYSPNAGGTTTLLFFNSNITDDTKAYYYSALQKTWVYCQLQDVAGNGAYVYVTVTNTSKPSNAELNGTVFALVQQKSIPDAPVINTPGIGDTDVSIEPMFTWDAVKDAVRYEISVADDPSFTFLTLSHNVEGITFYKADADNEEALDYDTTYYWRVRAVLEDAYAAGTPATAYTVGIFTTEAEPVVVEPAEQAEQTIVTVEPTKPEVNVEIPPTKITVEPASAAIPTYILWIIVVVGAVLIIALIVLIVRTRRVA